MLVQMDTRSIISTIFRQIWKFMLVFIPIFAIGLIYALTATKYYASTTQLLVKFGQDARPEISIGAVSGLSAEEKRGLVQANLNILLSRDVGMEVINKVGLEKLYPEIAAKDQAKEILMDSAFKTFAKNLENRTESNAGTIVVTFYHKDPKLAKETLQTLTDVFIDRQSNIFGNPQIEVLREQAEATKKRLEEANTTFNEYKNDTGIASIDEELTLLLGQRANLTGYLARRQIDVPANQSRSDNGDGESQETNDKTKTSYTALPARIAAPGDTSRFPLIEESQRKIDELRSMEAELLLTYKSDSERVRSVRRNIAMEQAALKKSLQALNAQIEDLDRQIAEKQEFRTKYDELMHEVEYSTEAFKTAQERLNAAEVNNDLNQRKITRISVIEAPSIPLNPAKPNKMMIVVLCILAGGMLGVALGLGTELMDSTFSRPEQLNAALKRPVLASFRDYKSKPAKTWNVPEPIWKNKTVSKYIPMKPVITFSAPSKKSREEVMGKELGDLYRGIEAALPAGQSRIINFSSTHLGEGATSIAYQLAKLAATQTKQDVLFIGSENFLPSGSPLPPRASASLIDVAMGRAQLKDSLAGVQTENGTLSHAYLQKGGSENIIGGLDKLEDVLKDLKKSYSLIIVPTPGIISNPVAAILSRVYDGIVFVVEAERTRAPVVKQALQSLGASNDKVLGMVLNKQRHYIPNWLYSRL